MTTLFTSPRLQQIRKAVLGTCVCAALGFATAAQADVLYMGSGTNAETGHAGQSATALFSLATNALSKLQTLSLTLTNTVDKTRDQGDVLTGVLFDYSGKVSLSLISISVGAGSKLSGEDEAEGSKSSLAGSWSSKLATKPALAASYGLSTTTFNGEFQNTFTKGSSSTDYGLIGVNSSVENIKSSHSPYVEDSITFKLSISGGMFSEADLGKLSFLYGSNGKGVINGMEVVATPSLALSAAETPSNVPEPTTLALLVLAFGVCRRARRRCL